MIATVEGRPARAPADAGAVALSLVVCTRDRDAVLGDALATLDRLRCRRSWELVLVDNGSRDGTRARLDAFAARATVTVRVLGEPRPGLGRARNAGVLAARGAIVAFTDDDCYPAPDYLDAVLAVFDDPAVGYMGGRITLFDPGDDPVTTRDVPHATPLPPRSFVPAGLIQGANMAARRDVLLAVRLFDPELGAGTPFCNEDVDFVARASAAGYAGGYFPGPCVAHHHRRRSAGAVGRLRAGYDRARGAYYAKQLLDDGPVRREYARALYWSLRGVPARPAVRELAGALHYAAHRAARALR
ncbi:MAG: hypothetical protein AVDCRST_MAG11-1309 [uncultured Gemmatimonadaceae bacterium]|uniref:Glycosyltransferase 2-like domain-containing protein n=1 Tax=uncultured Gemmatimonadaceae bacterium TaxID=246130 RepID=A0A6J4KLD2_9BACT|nr:MAG: hypothetical protein AVDCRST_MAG11-1309 [uncultured Gemmatimonadaceae bacterium]